MASAEKLTIRISTEGRVTLPESVRQSRQWQAGTRLVVEETADGVLLKDAPAFEPKCSDEVFGSLKVPIIPSSHRRPPPWRLPTRSVLLPACRGYVWRMRR